MSRTPCLALVLSAAVLAAPILSAPAHAAPARRMPLAELLLKRAERLYEQLEYTKALRVLIKVHQTKGVNKIQRARAYLYMGVCFTALGRSRDAVAAFKEVLKRRPNFRMPTGVSPSIRAMFMVALRQMRLPAKAVRRPGRRPTGGGGGGGGVDVDARAPREVSLGKPVAVKIKIDDPAKRIRKLWIRWRLRRGPDFSTVKLAYKPGTKKLEGLIPAATLGKKPATLTYYVEARDYTGRVVARSGSEDDPHELSLIKAKGKGSNVGWWLLGIGGAAAVAGGIIAAILLTRGDGGVAPPPAGQADISVVLK